MRLRGPAALVLVGLAACIDFSTPRTWQVGLQIVPEFDRTDPYAVATAASADSLRIRIVGAAAGGAFTDTVKRATVPINPDSGTAGDTLTVTLLESPQSFVIVLIAVRNSDGAVLFYGLDTVSVSATSGPGGGQQVSIPVTYTGPRAARLVLAPADTAITAGSSFTLRVTTYDSLDNVVNVEARFYLVNAGDASKLAVNRLTGLVTSVAGQTGAVLVYAHTPDTAALDTAQIYLGAVPAAVRVTPGFAAVAAGGTVTLTGQVVDASGNPVGGTSVAWTSRTTSVATVTGTGAVSGVAAGTTVVVATGSGFSDSALVAVPPATNVLVSTTSSGRAFRSARVGDTVLVDLAADMRFASGDTLGSYQVTLTWAVSALQFIDIQAGGAFGGPSAVNSANASTGQLIFNHANAVPGAAGTGVVALTKVRFRATAASSTSISAAVSEMSGVAPRATNFMQANRVTVANGSVTVRP